MPYSVHARSLALRPGTRPCQRRRSAGGRKGGRGLRPMLSPVCEAIEEADPEVTSRALSAALPHTSVTAAPVTAAPVTSTHVTSASHVTPVSVPAGDRRRKYPVPFKTDSLLKNVLNKSLSEKLNRADQKWRHSLSEREGKRKRSSLNQKENGEPKTRTDDAVRGGKGKNVIRFSLQDEFFNSISDFADMPPNDLQEVRARSALPSLTSGDRSPRDHGRLEEAGYHANDGRHSPVEVVHGSDCRRQLDTATRTPDVSPRTPRLTSPGTGNRREEKLKSSVDNYILSRELAKMDLIGHFVENGTMLGGGVDRGGVRSRGADRGGLKSGGSDRGGLMNGDQGASFPELPQADAGRGGVTSRHGGAPTAHSHSARDAGSRQRGSSPVYKPAGLPANARSDVASLVHASPSPRASLSPRSPRVQQRLPSHAALPLTSPVLPHSTVSPGFLDSLYSALTTATLTASPAMSTPDQLRVKPRRTPGNPWTPRSGLVREPAHVRLSRPKMSRPSLRRPGTQTATTRKSNMSGSAGSAVGTAGTSTSGESQPPETLEEYERRLTVEKCLRWMETLPDKFTGLHIVMSPVPSADES